MSEVLTAKKRTETGTLRMRRLRQAGEIPAILYGHGRETVSLSIEAGDVRSAIRHGNLLVELKGDVNESALIKEVQWDQLGSDVLHLDLARVDVTERIEVTVPVEVRGVAPGTREGGIVSQVIHELTIVCAANQIPEKLELNINELQLDQSLTLADLLMLPEGAEMQIESDTIAVTCVEPTVAPDAEDEESTGTPAEPEVIGRADADDEGGDKG